METYDVIIVGAGPAGISTALYLQQMAPDLANRTLVLEKARHPRPKPCAGGILPDGIALLRDLGLNWNEVPHVDAVFAHFQFEGRGVAVTAKSAPIAFAVVYRPELDAWLVRKAQERGIRILENTPVQHVLVGKDAVEVITPEQRYRAQVVVGADGARSVVRRVVNTVRPRFARTLLLWTPLSPRSSHQSDRAYLDFSCIPKGVPGYIWDFPVERDGQLMRCWGIYTVGRTGDDPSRMRGLLQNMMVEHGYRLEDYRLYGGIIPQFTSKGAFAAPRVILVGDAAGTDPLFGEGIAPSLGYGQLAAVAVAKAFAHGDFSFRGYRRLFLKSELGRMLRWRTLIAQVIYRLPYPAVQRLIWWRLGNWIQWGVDHLFTGWAQRAQGKHHPSKLWAC